MQANSLLPKCSSRYLYKLINNQSNSVILRLTLQTTQTCCKPSLACASFYNVQWQFASDLGSFRKPVTLDFTQSVWQASNILKPHFKPLDRTLLSVIKLPSTFSLQYWKWKKKCCIKKDEMHKMHFYWKKDDRLHFLVVHLDLKTAVGLNAHTSTLHFSAIH